MCSVTRTLVRVPCTVCRAHGLHGGICHELSAQQCDRPEFDPPRVSLDLGSAGWDATLNGVRYIQAALAYPHEWKQRADSLQIGDLPTRPVLVFNGSAPAQGGGVRDFWPLVLFKAPRVVHGGWARA